MKMYCIYEHIVRNKDRLESVVWDKERNRTMIMVDGNLYDLTSLKGIDFVNSVIIRLSRIWNSLGLPIDCDYDDEVMVLGFIARGNRVEP